MILHANFPFALNQGTWQFMSVDMLSKRAKVVDVADDLESFFYVILYYASRYLKSNVEDVGAFIEGLFDSYELVGGRYLVGRAKSTAIYSSDYVRLTPASGSPFLHFSSPLDQLLLTLRGCFHSLYKVREYDSQEVIFPIPPTDTTQSDPPCTPSKAKEDSDACLILDLDDEDDDEDDDDEETIIQPAASVPTQEDRTRAANAANYGYMLRLLKRHIQAKWPPIKNEGDLIPANWESRCDFGPSVTPSNQAPSKRPRPPTHSVIGVSPEDEPVVAVEKVMEKERRVRAPRVQRQGVRRSARIANKA